MYIGCPSARQLGLSYCEAPAFFGNSKYPLNQNRLDWATKKNEQIPSLIQDQFSIQLNLTILFFEKWHPRISHSMAGRWANRRLRVILLHNRAGHLNWKPLNGSKLYGGFPFLSQLSQKLTQSKHPLHFSPKPGWPGWMRGRKGLYTSTPQVL